MNTATKPAAPTTAVRVLKIATCPSLSGKSTLTYHIGFLVDSDRPSEERIQLRVFDNTNIGFFSQEWVPFSVIQGEFAKVPAEKPITSFLLHPLFRGKSVNTPAFLFAILKAEGLVQPAKDKQRQYERMDPAGFLAMVKALIESDVDLKVVPRSVRGEVKQAPGTKQAKGGESKAGDQPAKTTGKTKRADARPSAVAPTAAVPPIDVPQFITAKSTGKSTEKSIPQPTEKRSAGVDIAEIVEVINAKVPQEAAPAMPAAKTTKKATAKTASKAK